MPTYYTQSSTRRGVSSGSSRRSWGIGSGSGALVPVGGGRSSSSQVTTMKSAGGVGAAAGAGSANGGGAGVRTSSFFASSINVEDLQNSLGSLAESKSLRVDEKQQLSSLNNRLVGFMGKVRQLEDQNMQLKAMLEQSSGVEVKSGLPELWEREMQALRQELEAANHERTRLEVRIEGYETEIGQLNNRLDSADQIINDLEVELAAARKDCDDATVVKVDMESKLEIMKTEIAFLNDYHEQQILELEEQLRQRMSVVPAVIESDHTYEMQEVIDNLRAEYEQTIRRHQQEAKDWAETKIKIQKDDTVKIEGLRRDVMEWKSKATTAEMKIASYEGMLKSIREQLHEQELRHEKSLNAKQDAIRELQGSISEIKARLTAQLREYQDLMNVKLKLDAEIAAYRELLEVEEERYSAMEFASQEASQTKTVSIEEVEERHKAELARLEADIERYRADIANLQEQLKLIETRNSSSSAEFKTEIDGYKSQIHGYTLEIEGYRTEIASLQDRLRELDARREREVQAKVDIINGLEGQIRDLRTEIHSVQSSVQSSAVFEKQVAGLESRITSLQGEIDSKLAIIRERDTMIADLRAQIAQLKRDVDAGKRDVDAKWTLEINEKTKIISRMESDMAALRLELSGKAKEYQSLLEAKMMLEKTLRESEDRHKKELRGKEDFIHELEREKNEQIVRLELALKELRGQIDGKASGYDELNRAKLALERQLQEMESRYQRELSEKTKMISSLETRVSTTSVSQSTELEGRFKGQISSLEAQLTSLRGELAAMTRERDMYLRERNELRVALESVTSERDLCFRERAELRASAASKTVVQEVKQTVVEEVKAVETPAPRRSGGFIRMNFSKKDLMSILVQYKFFMTYMLSGVSLTERSGSLVLEQKAAVVSQNQLWNLEDKVIISSSSGLALEVKSGRCELGAEVVLSRRTGSKAQKWDIDSDEIITSALGDLILDLVDGKLVLNKRGATGKRQDWNLQIYQ
ncbi:PREDICTED: neurofilament medium polypeptide-like [Branchiostoma belcheri]|uniref:Neurofilament medium polypeptide-like n=1 Tax=Branchiostoma belcheri TaxID=7741 RepID=A0A6P4XFS9_BRABE|nr:PREDICTED: neurofilament medium polypeptide-like [Branchiostoma belcheri]